MHDEKRREKKRREKEESRKQGAAKESEKEKEKRKRKVLSAGSVSVSFNLQWEHFVSYTFFCFFTNHLKCVLRGSSGPVIGEFTAASLSLLSLLLSVLARFFRPPLLLCSGWSPSEGERKRESTHAYSRPERNALHKGQSREKERRREREKKWTVCLHSYTHIHIHSCCGT